MSVENLIETLADIVGAQNVITDAQTMHPYLGDWRGRYRGAARCVVRPGSTAEVAGDQRRVALLPAIIKSGLLMSSI